MAKRVLVLCQRKQGMDSIGKSDVKDTVIPKINEYVKKVLGPNTRIEYLTDDKSDPTVDFNFTLEKGEREADEFISNHRGMYSLIILNTCPFLYMDFELIHSLLHPGGIMVFKVFPNNNINKDYFTKWSSGLPEINRNIESLHQYFTNILHPEFDHDNYHVYQKKTHIEDSSLGSSPETPIEISEPIGLLRKAEEVAQVAEVAEVAQAEPIGLLAEEEEQRQPDSVSDEDILNSNKKYKIKDPSIPFKFGGFYYFIDPITKKMKKLRCVQYSNMDNPEDCIFDNGEIHSNSDKAWRSEGWDIFSMGNPFTSALRQSKKKKGGSRKYKNKSKKLKRLKRSKRSRKKIIRR
jgi:hypothetical protein